MALTDKRTIYRRSVNCESYTKHGKFNYLNKAQTKLLEMVMRYDMYDYPVRSTVRSHNTTRSSMLRRQAIVYSLEQAGLVKVEDGLLIPLWEGIEALYMLKPELNPIILNRFIATLEAEKIN